MIVHELVWFDIKNFHAVAFDMQLIKTHLNGV